MRLASTTGAVVFVAILVAGCSDDGGSSEETTVEPDLERYCELADELAEASAEALGDAASEEEFDEAREEFVDDNETALDEQVSVAPDEISSEAEIRLDTLRRDLEGDEISDDELEAQADANQTIIAFEEENC
jgi:hypothetical protein